MKDNFVNKVWTKYLGEQTEDAVLAKEAANKLTVRLVAYEQVLNQITELQHKIAIDPLMYTPQAVNRELGDLVSQMTRRLNEMAM